MHFKSSAQSLCASPFKEKEISAAFGYNHYRPCAIHIAMAMGMLVGGMRLPHGTPVLDINIISSRV